MERQETMDGKVVCLIALKNNKLLLIKKQNVWILPGGNQVEGEDEIKCLERNLVEQLPCLKLNGPNFFGGFFGKSAFGDYNLEALAYRSEISGEAISGENFSSGWFSSEELDGIKISEITKKAVSSLRDEKRL